MSAHYRLMCDMIITNNTIFQGDYEGVGSWGGPDSANHEENCLVRKVIIPDKFSSDVKALCEYAGIETMTPGMHIKMSLQEALTIIPKKRRRTESYKPLISFLNDEMGITLELTTLKNKSYGRRNERNPESAE